MSARADTAEWYRSNARGELDKMLPDESIVFYGVLVRRLGWGIGGGASTKRIFFISSEGRDFSGGLMHCADQIADWASEP